MSTPVDTERGEGTRAADGAAAAVPDAASGSAPADGAAQAGTAPDTACSESGASIESSAGTESRVTAETVVSADVLPFPGTHAPGVDAPGAAEPLQDPAAESLAAVAVTAAAAAMAAVPVAAEATAPAVSAVDAPPTVETSTPAIAPAAPPPAPPTPGERLRAAREARQLGAQQVTDTLHIEPRLITAMESDDFAAFDAPVYARGFLRKYAEFLGLPADEILAGYERLHAGPVAPTMLPTAAAEAPPRDWSFLTLPALVAAALVLVGGAGGWWWTHRAPAVAPAPVAATSAPAQAPAVPAPAPETGAAGIDAAGDAGPAATPAPLDESLAGTSSAPPAVAAVVPAPPPTVPSGAALEIEFVGDCWVEVTGPSGTRLMYDLGRRGESRALPGPGPWRVFLGAADGARLRVSGRPVIVPAARRSGPTARLVVGPDGAVQ